MLFLISLSGSLRSILGDKFSTEEVCIRLGQKLRLKSKESLWERSKPKSYKYWRVKQLSSHSLTAAFCHLSHLCPKQPSVTSYQWRGWAWSEGAKLDNSRLTKTQFGMNMNIYLLPGGRHGEWGWSGSGWKNQANPILSRPCVLLLVVLRPLYMHHCTK